jgi:hypothetical protein
MCKMRPTLGLFRPPGFKVFENANNKKEVIMVTLDVIVSSLAVLLLGATLVAAREKFRRPDLRPMPVQARRMRRINRRY